jgi:murein L,D-transpeptidase YafK
MRQRRIHFLIVLIAALRCVAAAGTIQADKIVIMKSARTMTLLSGPKILKTYRVALGSVPIGPKRVEGDHKTPEGDYRIDAKNSHSRSISRCTFLIPARQISNECAARAYVPAAQL